MISSRLNKAFLLISLSCLTGVTFAGARLNLAQHKPKKSSDSAISYSLSNRTVSPVSFPEDRTQRFSVRELQIRGNDLISTAELLDELPTAYMISISEGDEPVEEIYDFRALNGLICNPGVAREVSLKTIQGLTKYILRAYQAKGYAGIYVYVPAETVRSKARLAGDVLLVQVIEGKIEQVSVGRYDFDRNPRDKAFLKESALKKWSPVEEGDVIRKKGLDDFVRLLNLNPDRHVSPVISRGSEPNALNLTYDVYKTSPWHRYIQADDSGTKDRQWNPRLGVINTNLTGIDDRFSVMYQAPWERGIENEYAVFGSYDFPVMTPRLRMNLYSGYSQFDIPASGISFIGNGSFFGSKLSYNVLQTGGWFVDVVGSLSNERSKVTPSLGIASDVDMELWGVGLNIHRSDEMSDSSLTLNRTENMGGSCRRRFEESRLDADPDFSIYSVAINHSRYLDSNRINRISGSFRSVTADERLVPAKMTTFGGLYSVRGYEEDEVVADGGILISAQYEFDQVRSYQSDRGEQNSSESNDTGKRLIKKFAPLVFIDWGRAKTKHPVAGERRVHELCSIGTGLIFEVGDDFTGQLYYGWPLRGTDETDRGHGRLNASFVTRF